MKPVLVALWIQIMPQPFMTYVGFVWMVGQVTWLVQGVQVGKYYMKSFGRDMIDLIRFRCKSIIGHLAAESTGVPKLGDWASPWSSNWACPWSKFLTFFQGYLDDSCWSVVEMGASVCFYLLINFHILFIVALKSFRLIILTFHSLECLIFLWNCQSLPHFDCNRQGFLNVKRIWILLLEIFVVYGWHYITCMYCILGYVHNCWLKQTVLNTKKLKKEYTCISLTAVKN